MKRLQVFTICLGLSLIFPPISQAAAKVFKNCTELNKMYPGGVAIPGAINAGGVTKNTPKYNKALYISNQKSDRDKDGIACEKWVWLLWTTIDSQTRAGSILKYENLASRGTQESK